MDKQANKEHWASWAQEHGEKVQATTRTATAKLIEIGALRAAISQHIGSEESSSRILEVGCGNGVNCVRLAQSFPNIDFVGLDYVPEMVMNAQQLATKEGVAARCTFEEGDALDLDRTLGDTKDFDIAFTVRCLINLQTDDNQVAALASLVSRVRPGGLILLIENSQQSYARQNALREMLGMEPRTPAAFNHFIDEELFFTEARKLPISHVKTVDISSLHDVLLYVLVPATNGGVVDYEHPLVSAATDLELRVNDDLASAFGGFGQNRLFIFQRTA